MRANDEVDQTIAIHVAGCGDGRSGGVIVGLADDAEAVARVEAGKIEIRPRRVAVDHVADAG